MGLHVHSIAHTYTCTSHAWHTHVMHCKEGRNQHVYIHRRTHQNSDCHTAIQVIKWPTLLLRVWSAPLSNRRRTTAVCPQYAANIKAVQSSCTLCEWEYHQYFIAWTNMDDHLASWTFSYGTGYYFMVTHTRISFRSTHTCTSIITLWKVAEGVRRTRTCSSVWCALRLAGGRGYTSDLIFERWDGYCCCVIILV